MGLSTVFWDSQGVIFIAYQIVEENTSFGEENSGLLSGEPIRSHLYRRRGQIGRIKLRPAIPFTVFSRLSSLRFFCFQTKVTRWIEIRRGCRLHEDLLEDLQKIYFSNALKNLDIFLSTVSGWKEYNVEK